MAAAVYRGRKCPMITIRANAGEKAAINAMAAELGLTVSDLLRSGLAMVQAEIMAGTFKPTNPGHTA